MQNGTQTAKETFARFFQDKLDHHNLALFEKSGKTFLGLRREFPYDIPYERAELIEIPKDTPHGIIGAFRISVVKGETLIKAIACEISMEFKVKVEIIDSHSL